MHVDVMMCFCMFQHSPNLISIVKLYASFISLIASIAHFLCNHIIGEFRKCSLSKVIVCMLEVCSRESCFLHVEGSLLLVRIYVPVWV